MRLKPTLMPGMQTTPWSATTSVRPSVEINVEGLIAELEAESRFVSKPDMISARRKLEDFLERRRVAREIEDFDDFKVLD